MAEFPASKQLSSTAEFTPPPLPAEQLVKTQFSNVPLNAPPPFCVTAHVVKTQFVTNTPEDSHHTPPPLCSKFKSPVAVMRRSPQ